MFVSRVRNKEPMIGISEMKGTPSRAFVSSLLTRPPSTIVSPSATVLRVWITCVVVSGPADVVVSDEFGRVKSIVTELSPFTCGVTVRPDETVINDVVWLEVAVPEPETFVVEER